LKEVISVSPVSLSKLFCRNPEDSSNPNNYYQKHQEELTLLIQDLKVTLDLFNDLKGAFQPGGPLPSDLVRAELMLILKDLYSQIDIVKQVHIEHPESFDSAFAELRAKGLLFSLTANFASDALPMLLDQILAFLYNTDTLFSMTDRNEIINYFGTYVEQLQKLNTALSSSRTSQNLIYNLDFNNQASIANVLSYIPDPYVRAHTQILIEYAKYFNKNFIKNRLKQNDQLWNEIINKKLVSTNKDGEYEFDFDVLETQLNAQMIADIRSSSKSLFDNLKELIANRIDNQVEFGKDPFSKANQSMIDYLSFLTNLRFLREACEAMMGIDVQDNI